MNMGDTHSQSAQPKLSLPAYFLNAENLLRRQLPDLVIGNRDETIGGPPPTKQHYKGGLGHWKEFRDLAIRFMEDERLIAELKRCSHAPIAMDPVIKELNSSAIAGERIQVGAEITMSGRFGQNVLVVSDAIVATLSNPQHGQPIYPDFLPDKVTYGDSWVLKTPLRIPGKQPDVLMKLPSDNGTGLRLVGELKFPVGSSLQEMINRARANETDAFRNLLGAYAFL